MPATRLPPLRPLTKTETSIVEALLGPPRTNREIAMALGMSPFTVKNHIERVAMKIPGTLPAKVRVILWARGADTAALGLHTAAERQP